MKLEINAQIVFGFSPQGMSEKEQECYLDMQEFYKKGLRHFGFRVVILETAHYDECNQILPECAALDLMLSHQVKASVTLHNLLQIAEASLRLFPDIFYLNRFDYTFS